MPSPPALIMSHSLSNCTGRYFLENGNNSGDVGRLVLWPTLMGMPLASLPGLALGTSMLRKDPSIPP